MYFDTFSQLQPCMVSYDTIYYCAAMVLLTLRVSFSKFIDEDEDLLQLEKSEGSESSEEGARGDMESFSHDGASTSSTFVYNIKV